MLDAEIEALDLAATARTAAYVLKAAHPAVTFTSGRRHKADQARAMASKVVKNRKSIEETYAVSDLRTALQKWVVPPGRQRVWRSSTCNCQARVVEDGAGRIVGLGLRSAC